MIQLRKAGLVADGEDVRALRIQFEKNHWVRLPSVLDPELLSLALSRIEQGKWLEQVVSGTYSYSEFVLETGAASNLLHFVSNAPKFLEAISEITGCDSLSWFESRIYRMDPDGHADDWHNDVMDGRLIAMSLNLSPRGYHGGVFQMRERKSRRMLAEVANTGLGDAILFGLSRDFEHRVSAVETGEPKTAFAGWFSNDQSVRERMSRQESVGTVR